MPKKPCHCPNCKGTLRDPKTIKAHIRNAEAIITTAQDENELEHAIGRRAAGEESSGERHSDDEENDIGSEEDLQRPQKRSRTVDSNAQSRLGIKQEDEEDYSDEDEGGTNSAEGTSEDWDDEDVDPKPHPDEKLIDLSDPDLRLSLDLYMSCINEPEPEAIYNSLRNATIRRFPQLEVLSYLRAKKIIAADISDHDGGDPSISLNSIGNGQFDPVLSTIVAALEI